MSVGAGVPRPEVAVTRLLTGINSLFLPCGSPGLSDLAVSTFTHWNRLAGPQVLFFILPRTLQRLEEGDADIQVTLREFVLSCKHLGAPSEMGASRCGTCSYKTEPQTGAEDTEEGLWA